MNAETMRQRMYEELRNEFESKLRDVRRQKQLADEEMEKASERWRTERRRLHSEIDRLEAALADAKEARSRRRKPDPQRVDPLELATFQASADERLRKAEQDWEAERRRLKAETGRLQTSIAEAIARSNNPLRSPSPLVQQLEAQLANAQREKAEIAASLERATAEWLREKKKLAGDIVRMRPNAGKSKPEDGGILEASPIEAELKRVEDQRQEIVRTLDDPETELSVVVRKNVEKAEADAYLKGIQFALSHSKVAR